MSSMSNHTTNKLSVKPSSAPYFTTNPQNRYNQVPIAVVGLACRLPGNCNSPTALWDFLERCGCAENEPPRSRFNLAGHYDGSKKPGTMVSPGGVFLEHIDPHDLDAQFFKLSKSEAIAMDPQQRQLLEVVYEGLENAGINLEALDGKAFGCFVGSYASDYGDIQSRDPENRAAGTVIGVGRAMLSNRISHFLNIKGPSMTIDTACSSSLVGLDVACRYLHNGEITGAIIGACNLYLSPEHAIGSGTASPSGRCHTFDIKADGYIKAEAVNVVILKRLSDALRDGDPVRGVIRGSATNSDGWTAGIASPSSEAQAAAIRQAYANAGISDLSATSYLECHGTGTKAGDPIEVNAVASVFSETRLAHQALVIGSIKSNIGHSEPAAGISGLLKALLSLEKGIIPGNPTFETPNPKIDFETLRVRATRTTIHWPIGGFRRASVNSFGFGGSNSHVVLDHASGFLGTSKPRHVSSFLSDSDDLFADEPTQPLFILVFSANDEESLRSYCDRIIKHLIDPAVRINLRDLAFTLSEKRTRHFHLAYTIAQTCCLEIESFIFGKLSPKPPRIAYVFTGQGAQWPQMAKGIIDTFPIAKRLLKHLDSVLQSLPNPPSWSLICELSEPRTAEHLRLPEFSQPLVTALQLAILAVLNSWGIQYESTIGHSSGEIAAAAASGFLTVDDAIKVAFYRGRAASDIDTSRDDPVGMLAVGLGADEIRKYMVEDDVVEIGCINSPHSVTLSGQSIRLEVLKSRIQNDGYFARVLPVDLAYHSSFINGIATHYASLLEQHGRIAPARCGSRKMFSTVTGRNMDVACDVSYWKSNMTSPVLFNDAFENMISKPTGPDFVIEIGPSGALAGPIAQIKKELSKRSVPFDYVPAFTRGTEPVNAMYHVAGKLFVLGGSVDLSSVNKDEDPEQPSIIVDLPNYAWNHSVKYWHESDSSVSWRSRKFVQHDLLGSKVLGTSWEAPSWRKTLRVDDLPWLKDHKLGNDIILPAAVYIAMAAEALYQTLVSKLVVGEDIPVYQLSYRLRDIVFIKAMILAESEANHSIMFTLNQFPGTKDSWYEFKVFSSRDSLWSEHCNGLIRLAEVPVEVNEELRPIDHGVPGRLWYKAMRDVGLNFGPAFQKLIEIESTSGALKNRALVSLSEPHSTFSQSVYPLHPTCIDGCFQSGVPSLWQGHRSGMNTVLIPAMIDDLVINAHSGLPRTGTAVASANFIRAARPGIAKSYKLNASVYDSTCGALLFQMTGLRCSSLDTRDNLHASHTYTHLVWKPDISFLLQDQLHGTSCAGKRVQQPLTSVHVVFDLIVHKTPNLAVMEFSTLDRPASIWLDRLPSSASVHRRYLFGCANTKALFNAQERYSAYADTAFKVLDLAAQEVGPDRGEMEQDLVIILLRSTSGQGLTHILNNASRVLTAGGSIVLLDYGLNDLHVISTLESLPSLTFQTVMKSEGSKDTLQMRPGDRPSEEIISAYVAAPTPSLNGRRGDGQKVDLACFSNDQCIHHELKEALTRLGWKIEDHVLPFDRIQRSRIVLILDDLYHPVLSSVKEERWRGLKHVLSEGCKILWVTVGSQFRVTHPENALIHGMARTLRSEDPALMMVTLDLESSSNPINAFTINQILAHMEKSQAITRIESEFCERDGIVYIGRVLPDDMINKTESNDKYGAEPVIQSLHDHESCVRLQCGRVGVLDSVQYVEVLGSESLQDTFVEVELHAASLNFKDLLHTMGIVPGDEHLLGWEGAGVVRRVGHSVDCVKIGQRVLVNRKGCFANRVQCPMEAVYPLPPSLSFEDAATLSVVYSTAIYSLMDLANLQRGQSILIHSAAGGVGIAAIQLCQYLGAEIYATVGTEEKKNFLTKTFGISPTRIFSSRSTTFASSLMRATGSRGVDVILNSLSGDLLDASWRCIADHGTMIEIGKKDMISRNSLSMEPFDRMASYRAVDISHESFPISTVARLLQKIFHLLEEGHIRPIAPLKTFSFSDVAAAFRHMKSGIHIGKIVLSDGSNRKVQVPIRSAPRKLLLRSDASYLIVGGLKGLCGSLAIFLARHGAKSLIVVSRSGHDDEKSKMIVTQVRALGSEISLLHGNVTNPLDVHKIFQNPGSPPIAGVIHGAMVLRDKIFSSMTVEEFHEAIEPKVRGAWNLHNAILEKNLSLDFFTLLSSISGVVGQKSQANYAAANAFLDSFAEYRRGLGLPACAVDLGVIEDVGYISEREVLAKRLDNTIWTGINEGLLHKILRFSILQQGSVPINPRSASQMITGLPVPQAEDSFLLRDARFSGLCIRDSKTKRSGHLDQEGSRDVQVFLTMLKAKAEPTALLAAATDLVNRQLTKSLGLEKPMEPGRSLSDYGIDSLSAVDFRNWVHLKLDGELTTLEIINAKSLSSLCETIIAKLSHD